MVSRLLPPTTYQSIEEDKDSHFYINRPDAVQSDAMLELETWKPESPTLLMF